MKVGEERENERRRKMGGEGGGGLQTSVDKELCDLRPILDHVLVEGHSVRVHVLFNVAPVREREGERGREEGHENGGRQEGLTTEKRERRDRHRETRQRQPIEQHLPVQSFSEFANESKGRKGTCGN
eukprot:2181309-Rhodomonas_salina.2